MHKEIICIYRTHNINNNINNNNNNSYNSNKIIKMMTIIIHVVDSILQTQTNFSGLSILIVFIIGLFHCCAISTSLQEPLWGNVLFIYMFYKFCLARIYLELDREKHFKFMSAQRLCIWNIQSTFVRRLIFLHSLNMKYREIVEPARPLL